MKHLCVTVRFLDALSHGRNEGGDPEWPPSPLRLFQALVAASAAKWNERTRIAYAAPSLEWLERQPAPTIVAARFTPSAGRRHYVPDNVTDKVARSWQAGNPGSIADYRTEKDVAPAHLAGDAVHYLFPLADGECPHFAVLEAAVRAITHLGWGVDLVVAGAAIVDDADLARLDGERWRPTVGSGAADLRLPVAGTLAALAVKHTAFLNRLEGDLFRPVPALSQFAVVGYRRASDEARRPFAAFATLKDDGSRNVSFAAAQSCRDVVAWVRHAVATVCEGWPFGSIEGFVHGHDGPGKPIKGDQANERFQYLPLPTINAGVDHRAEGIRRILVTAPPGFDDRVAWVRRRLAGHELIEPKRGEVMALLNLLPTEDWVLKRYVMSATRWTTVTPVILPGHDDRDGAKREAILRKAFAHAGLPADETIADLEWRNVGFRRGVDLATRFRRPDHMTGPAMHVRVTFHRQIRGPLAVGAGRYRGFGVFVADD